MARDSELGREKKTHTKKCFDCREKLTRITTLAFPLQKNYGGKLLQILMTTFNKSIKTAMTTSQWLTTKKRGKDDNLIEKDRMKALQIRRENKSAGRLKGLTGSAALGKRNGKSHLSKGKNKKDDDDDDEDSFIVNSSDEEIEIDDNDYSAGDDNDESDHILDDDDDDDDEDDVLDSDNEIVGSKSTNKIPPSSRNIKNKPTVTASKKVAKSKKIEYSDSSDDDNDGTFLQQFSRNTPALMAGRLAAKKDINTSSLNFTQPKMLGKIIPSFKKPHMKNLTKNPTNSSPKTSAANISENKNSDVIDLVDSSNDAHNNCLIKRNSTKAASNGKTNTHGNTLQKNLEESSKKITDSDNSSFDSASILFDDATKSVASKRKAASSISGWDELEDTPDKTNTKPVVKKLKTFKRLQKRIILDADDDDEVDFTQEKQLKPMFNDKVQNSAIDLDDECDEDEAVALAWALQESEAMSNKKDISKPPKKVKTVYKDDLEDENQNEDSDNNDEGDGIQDEYLDEDAKAASSILLTANALSAQVLQNMIHWTKQCSSSNVDGTENNSTEQKVPMGIIVDGALALSSMGIDASQDMPNSSWISNEVMQKILPNVKLADYQLIAVNWMALLHGMECEIVGDVKKSKSKRKTTNVNGILADEMGLGKTVQTIGFLSWLNWNQERIDDKQQINPHLVVAPASVLTNWEREFQKFAPHLTVIKYHGNLEERKDLKNELRLHLQGNSDNKTKGKNFKRVDVILASVTYFQKENSDDRSFLQKFQFEYLVVDEAHLLKNARGSRYKNLDRFKSNHRLLLTGTPVQNSPKELMSLLCFLMPLFSRKSSNDDDGYDNEGGHDGGESMLQHFVEAHGAHDDQAAYRKLKQLFAPFVLRRRKVDVLNQILPPKERRVELVQLDPYAKTIYDSILAEHIESKQNGIKCNFEHLFTQLRKAAHHPLLVRARHRSPSEKEHLVKYFHQYGAFQGDANTPVKVAKELEKFSDFEIHLIAYELLSENKHREKDIGRYILQGDDLFRSAKFERLRILLPELIEKGHRILIFSGWTTILDLLTCLMDSLRLKYMRMDGQTDVSTRQDLIDTFNNDDTVPVFLLSTKASGLGITLTSAQICIMHDLDFNPFNDLQAEDRCHRIGQTKKVTVLKMVTADTVDQDVYAMQERKAKMNAAIMDNDGQVDTIDSKDAKKAKDGIIESAVSRFLQTDTKNSTSTSSTKVVNKQRNAPNDKENQKRNNTIDVDTI